MTPISDEESDVSDVEPDFDANGEQMDVEPAEPSRRNPTRKSVRKLQVVEESESEESEDDEEAGTGSETE